MGVYSHHVMCCNEEIDLLLQITIVIGLGGTMGERYVSN